MFLRWLFEYYLPIIDVGSPEFNKVKFFLKISFLKDILRRSYITDDMLNFL